MFIRRWRELLGDQLAKLQGIVDQHFNPACNGPQAININSDALWIDAALAVF